MSVKRYTIYYNERERDMYVAESQDGKYIHHSDYAALLVRHNALLEAMKRYFASCASEQKIGIDEMADEEYHAWYTERIAAHAEVDRLLEEK